jgi:2-oxoglutarate ferredoxin oxidoreductase subunit beta
MNTYGIHSIHGRAPTLATGLKIANPELSVWVITGDGDALSIGGNHLLHACRRNIDIKIILFNNRIYGLTKGQYSPTSLQGTRTKSSPMGSIEQPLNPISVALSAEATFIARSVDVHTRHLQETLRAAAAHKGTAFVEVFQNCLIFNDGAWEHVTDRSIRDDNMLSLEHAKPMVFGRKKDKGIRMNGLKPEVVQIGNGMTKEDLLVHDESQESPLLAYLLSRLGPPDFPTPLGVFRNVQYLEYSDEISKQISIVTNDKGVGNLRHLFFNAETWEVDEDTQQIIEQDVKGTIVSGLDEEYIDELDQTKVERSAVEHSLDSDPISEMNPATPVMVASDTSLKDAIATMRSNNIGSILIVDQQGRLGGVFTERDVLTKIACKVSDLESEKVRDFMTSNPTTLELDNPIAYALHLMATYGFRHLPLVDKEKKPIGVISFRDIIGFIERYFAN